MDKLRATGEIAEHRKDIPKPLEVYSVRHVLEKGIIKPVLLIDKRGYSVRGTQASLMEVCDHLQIEYVKKEEYRGMEVVNKTVTEKKGVFSPDPGDEVTVIKVRKDMNFAELVELMAKIREISATKLTNPIDVKQMQEWAERVGGYSKQLREAGLAMERVRQLTPNPDKQWNELYTQTAETVFALGEAISLERRQNKPTTLARAYSELIREQGVEGIDNYLISGLNYARYGEKKKTIPPSAKEAFEKMAKVSARLAKGESPVGMTAAILETVIGQSLPKELDKVKQENKESKAQIKKIPEAISIEIALRGVEKMYQELPIPQVIKELLSQDIEAMDNVSRKQFIEKLGEQFDNNIIGALVSRFNIRYNFNLHSAFLKFKHAPSLSEIEGMERGPEAVTSLLVQWQEYLRTLGLGKENIQKFSQWLEDPEFFDQAKLEQLKELSYQDKGFSWEEVNLKSVKQVKEYYQKKLGAGEKVESEYTRFQKGMLWMVVDQIRTNYGGWLEDDSFWMLQDSSPSKINKRGLLNCVGRSNLLLVTAGLFGCQGRGVTTKEHMATSFELADGKTYIVDPSLVSYDPVGFAYQERDPEGLLREGESLYYSNNRWWLESEPSVVIASSIWANMNVYLPSAGNYSRTIDIARKMVFDETDIVNYFKDGFVSLDVKDGTSVTIEKMAKARKTSQKDIVYALKRLKLLAPDYVDKVKSSKENQFEVMVYRLMREAGIDN